MFVSDPVPSPFARCSPENVLSQVVGFRSTALFRVGEPEAASVAWDRLVGLVVKASASRAEDPGFESRLRRDLSGVESYQ